MKNLLIAFAMLVATSLTVSASPDNSAIVAATKSYVAQNSAGMPFTVTVEKISGDYARAKVTPTGGQTDPAWVFLKKKNGTWTGLTLGTGFTPDDYKRYGIPAALWVR